MKRNKKLYITIGSVILVLAIAVGGYFLYQREKGKTGEKENQENSQKTTETKSTDKTNNSQTIPQNIQIKPSTGTTATPTTLGNLSDVSLTAYLYKESAVAPDGTTTMPSGSIVPTFYAKSGTYTIQKMVGGAWKDIITNYSYPGHGGIAAWYDGPTEDSIQYRVLGVSGGKPTTVSKTFVVKRSDLSGGVFSYN